MGITSLLPCGAPGLNLGALGYLTCPIGFGIGSHAAQAGPELGVSVLGLEVCAVSGWLGWHVGTTFGQLGKTGRFLGMVGWPERRPGISSYAYTEWEGGVGGRFLCGYSERGPK